MLSSSLFDWIALTASVAISTRLITANTLPVVVSTLPTLGRLAVGVLAGIQIAFGVLLKLYFFKTA